MELISKFILDSREVILTIIFEIVEDITIFLRLEYNLS